MRSGARARLLGIGLAVGILSATPCRAADACPGFFLDGGAPNLVNARLKAQTLPLCFSAFGLLYSGASRTPLYAAERLTRQGVLAARAVDRVDSFHDEERVPAALRSRLDDYVHSGFDRGHMAPAADMPTAESQAESFSLANIVPQDRTLNRTLWAAIEESVRRLAVERGTLFVVTGPIFEGGEVASIKSRVLVPTQLFKAVYDPERREGAAYLAPNRADAEWRAVSLSDLSRIAGLDAFPTLPSGARTMTLPEPRAYSRDGAEPKERRREESLDVWMQRMLHRIVRRLWRDLMRAIF